MRQIMMLATLVYGAACLVTVAFLSAGSAPLVSVLAVLGLGASWVSTTLALEDRPKAATFVYTAAVALSVGAVGGFVFNQLG